VKLVLVLGRRDAIRKEFFETPDMVCEICGHRRGSLLPFALWRWLWNGDAQRLMRAYEIEDRILKFEMAPQVKSSSSNATTFCAPNARYSGAR
jgi:hypothetical protein